MSYGGTLLNIPLKLLKFEEYPKPVHLQHCYKTVFHHFYVVLHVHGELHENLSILPKNGCILKASFLNWMTGAIVLFFFKQETNAY